MKKRFDSPWQDLVLEIVNDSELRSRGKDSFANLNNLQETMLMIAHTTSKADYDLYDFYISYADSGGMSLTLSIHNRDDDARMVSQIRRRHGYGCFELTVGEIPDLPYSIQQYLKDKVCNM